MIQPPKIKSVNRFGSKTDPIKTAGFLASEQQKASEKAPRIGDIIASIGGQAKEALGEKPRGWRALASGISQGVENAGKLSSIFDRKQDMEKYNQVMNYLQETNNAAIKEKQWYEKIESASLKYAPQVLSFLKNSDKYDIQSADNIVDNLFSGWNRDTGQNWVKQGLHPTDRNLVFASDGADGPIQLLDMRDLFAGNDVIQNELAASSSSYQSQLQDERQRKQEKMDIEREKLDIARQVADAKIEKYKGEKPTSNEFDKTFAKESAKNAIKTQNEITNDYNEAIGLEEAANTLDEALKKGAFTNEGAKARLKQYIGEFTGGDKATATQIFEQGAGKLIKYIKEAFGGRVTNTDLEFAEKHMLPGSKLSKEANEKFISGLRKLIEKKKNDYRKFNTLVETNEGKIPADWHHQLNKVDNTKIQQPNIQGKRLVQDPNTNEQVWLTPEQADEAVQQGALILQ